VAKVPETIQPLVKGTEACGAIMERGLALVLRAEERTRASDDADPRPTDVGDCAGRAARDEIATGPVVRKDSSEPAPGVAAAASGRRA
jgi:hypothetical protein